MNDTTTRELRQEMIPAEADLMKEKVGRPGDLSRIEALARFYQRQSEGKSEKSPFLTLT